jgi:peptidoglycan/LPS O-acetylase OafA/YrhL
LEGALEDGHGGVHAGSPVPIEKVAVSQSRQAVAALRTGNRSAADESQRGRRDFRPDVEGLRAVAIAIVLVAHAGVGFATGGYVGVDVFFVISGFLITRLLVNELDLTGRLSLTRFYARRVKRLMPQVLTVSVVVVVASWVLFSPLRTEAVAADVIASGVYAMNWRLSSGAVDYFASGVQDGPLDHFWSLAVEEQFYIVWPLLVLAVTWRHRRGAGARRVLIIVLSAIAIASLLYAAYRARVAPEQAYFSAPARAWELAVGGLAAVGIRGPMGRRSAVAAAWSGAVAIGVATIAFDETTAFPGPPALVPTLGAIALVAAGTTVIPAAPTRFLTLRPVHFVGRVSYAWYVWHWPALVFAGALGLSSTAERLAVTVVSLIPAVVTHRYIEEPLRHSNLHVRMPRVTLVTAAAGAALMVASGVGLSASIRSSPLLAAADAEGAGQLQRTGAIQGSAVALRPSPRLADADRGRAYYDGCLVGERATRSPRCVYGDRGSKITVVLFGDSHAMQYFPAVEQIARRHRWRLVELTKAGCPPPDVRVVYVPSRREYTECDEWREHALQRIELVELPALVIAAASARYTVLDGGTRMDRATSTRALGDGYGVTLRRLLRTVPHVVVLADTPVPPRDIPDCVSGAMKHLRRCAFPRRQAVAQSTIVDAAAKRIKAIGTIDPTSQFCLGELCPAVIGDVLVYRNSGHITASFVATLAAWLDRRLPVLGGHAERSSPAHRRG